VVSDVQEVDVMMRNYKGNKVWADFDSIIFVECKNWFKDRRPGASILRDFKGKLDNKDLKTGIFVAPNGIAEGSRHDDKVYGADGQIDKFLQDGTKIVVLEDEDIWAIINCTDVTEQINKKFMELYKL
jgi:hypothetical protein